MRVRLFRFLRSIVTSPPVLGAAYVLALAAWAGQRGSEDDSDLGDVRRAEAVATFIERRFSAEIGKMKLGIVAAAIALGLALGLVAEILLRARNPRSRLARRASTGRFVESALLVAGVHAMLVLWAMADSPQLYAARWYANGGVARTVQVFATDLLGPRGIILLAFVLAVVYVRPARISSLALRVVAFLRGPVRRRLGLAAIGLVLLTFPFWGHEEVSVVSEAKAEEPPVRRR